MNRINPNILRNSSILLNKLTKNKARELLDGYIQYTHTIENINKGLITKKIRRPNFPSEVSENIAKYSYYKKYGVHPEWEVKGADLIDRINDRTIQVKAFSSQGPTSFGPHENWDLLYFVDATDYRNRNFKIYEIHKTDSDPSIQNIMVNSTETFGDQCEQKRRPRLKFSELKKQLKTELIFAGKIY